MIMNDLAMARISSQFFKSFDHHVIPVPERIARAPLSE